MNKLLMVYLIIITLDYINEHIKYIMPYYNMTYVYSIYNLGGIYFDIVNKYKLAP